MQYKHMLLALHNSLRYRQISPVSGDTTSALVRRPSNIISARCQAWPEACGAWCSAFSRITMTYSIKDGTVR